MTEEQGPHEDTAHELRQSTNAIDMDIASIEDPNLRRRIAAAFERLRSKAEYGLVFERHKPESVVLHGQTVREDRYATLRSDPGPRNAYRVLAIDGDTATLQPVDEHFRSVGQQTTGMLDELVPVARFGDPIFPGLIKSSEDVLGAVDGNGNPTKPFHTVVNGENFHALETLLYAYEGQVDCIYIDPPYNSGARDWKYNNDYVDKDDVYRHSLWLSFMEKRLKLAQRLLNPKESVLMVAIDDKEGARLGLLLESIFPTAGIEMVTTVINPRGKYRTGTFARSDEYVYFVTLGSATVAGEPDPDYAEGALVPWRTLRRSDYSSRRGSKKGGTGQFYPIYVNRDGRIEQVGEPLAHGVPRSKSPKVRGCVAVFPIRDDPDQTEMNWGLTAPELRARLSRGYVRVGKATPGKPQTYEISYLTSGKVLDVETGRAAIVGSNPDGSVLARYVTHKVKMPTSTWVRPSHNAEVHGTELLKTLLGGEKRFDFPKSLYAVEDCLRLFVADKPDALVIDFFGGSGTTAHALMRLNKDGGRRRSILVTNNEVSAGEQESLRARDLYPGDAEWEALGICEYVAKPRLRAAVTGRTPAGAPITGEYKVNGFEILHPGPMSEGFEENVRFYNLTYLDPETVEAKQSFEQVAHLLWLVGGAEGPVIETEPRSGWALPDGATYGVLFRNKGRAGFAEALSTRTSAGDPPRHVFIIADSADEFHRSVDEVGADPAHTTRLYRHYLKNFRTNVIDLKDQL
ncbi:site-specific DNA-methyltransferase [Microbacterium esteraromaticum]|uniref:Site-specific DNA-methyltransferase n=1 Tax=Microbacterium esteraromaticum TaxID=57043 RepID=A0A7D8AD09_9MICO|nr:DNA methyltransferase [Microbacterium esteraromaticum]QMU96302.1 site-specific DNA-methyltransferase [Microbacterium esteraromaticum]